MKRRLVIALTLFISLFITTQAHAHKPSDSYLTLTVSGSVVHGRWDIAVRDLAYARDIDTNGDAKVTWGELASKHEDITAYALSHLKLSGGGGGVCEARLAQAEGGHALASHSDGNYAVLWFEARCPSEAMPLAVEYTLFFDIDTQHRGLMHLEAESSRTYVFTAKDRKATFEKANSAQGQQFTKIVKEGVLHIWTGYDHVLFLLALLIPSVLRRNEDGKGWVPAPRLKTALVDVLRIVTAFTLAHSITLSLAALGVVTLPSRLVESAIAASVVLAALNNLYPILREDRWVAAFLLGLMHGFGFSSTLMDLDLPRNHLVLTLFGFNLGVEIGQVAIVCVFVPLAYAVRATTIYRRGMVIAGSTSILALALVWFIERAFVVKILP